MDGIDVDAGGVVVEHETVLELAAHARSLAGPQGTTICRSGTLRVLRPRLR